MKRSYKKFLEKSIKRLCKTISAEGTDHEVRIQGLAEIAEMRRELGQILGLGAREPRSEPVSGLVTSVTAITPVSGAVSEKSVSEDVITPKE